MRKLPVVPLGGSLPDLPTCSAKKVDIPKGDQDIMCLRINLPFCFSEYSWKQCQVKPANIISGLLRDNSLQDGLIGTYGWRTLESQQWIDYAEAVTGFLKIGPKITESVLKLSGNHGVFFEPLAKNRTNTVIDWIAQNKDESDDEYMTRVSAMEHTNGLTYRRQGKSRLGLRNPERSYQPPENRARVWEARGNSPRWSTGTISTWLYQWMVRCRTSGTTIRKQRLAFSCQKQCDVILLCLWKWCRRWYHNFPAFHQKKKPFLSRNLSAPLVAHSITAVFGPHWMALKVLYCQLAITTTSSLPHKDDMEEDEAAAHAESNSQADTGDVRMTEPSAVPLKEKLKAKLLTKSVPINKKKSPTIPLPTLKDFHFLILEEMATVPTDLWQLRMLSKTHVMSLKVSMPAKSLAPHYVRKRVLTSPNMNISNARPAVVRKTWGWTGSGHRWTMG